MDRDKKLPEDEELEDTVPTRSIHSLEDIDANLPGRSKDTEEEVEEIDEEEIDPLDDETEEDEKPAKPIVEEEIEEEEEVIQARPQMRDNTEVNRAEHNLSDLADEPVDEVDEEVIPREPFRRGDVGFGGNSNPNMDREPTYKTNFEPRREVEPDLPLNRAPLEDDGYQEVHIPNLRSPRFNQSVSNNPTHSAFSQDNYTPQDPFHPTPKKRGGASKIHLLILLLIGLAVIGGTVYFLKTQFKPAAPSPTPTPTPTATPAPTPTPEPQIDRAKFNIQVLNGTTTPGIAAGVITKLKELGYQTGPAGNAPKQNYTQTVISVKPGNADLMAVLTKDISGDYEASSGAELKDTSTYDAQIILGEK